VLRPAAKPSRAGYLIGESVLSLAVAHTRPRHLDRIDPEEALESFDATLDYLDFPQSLKPPFLLRRPERVGSTCPTSFRTPRTDSPVDKLGIRRIPPGQTKPEAGIVNPNPLGGTGRWKWGDNDYYHSTR